MTAPLWILQPRLTPLRGSAGGVLCGAQAANSQAVAGWNFTLYPGKTFGPLVGRKAAAGKSTLARMVTMIEGPDRGIADAGRPNRWCAKTLASVAQTRCQIRVQDPWIAEPAASGSVRSSRTLKNHPPRIDRKDRTAKALEMLGLVGLRPNILTATRIGSRGQRNGRDARALMLAPRCWCWTTCLRVGTCSIVRSSVLNLLR